MSSKFVIAESSSSSVSLNIVNTLEQFGKTALPVDFIAKKVGRPVVDVQSRLKSLADQGVVEIQGGKVILLNLDDEVMPLK